MAGPRPIGSQAVEQALNLSPEWPKARQKEVEARRALQRTARRVGTVIQLLREEAPDLPEESQTMAYLATWADTIRNEFSEARHALARVALRLLQLADKTTSVLDSMPAVLDDEQLKLLKDTCVDIYICIRCVCVISSPSFREPLI